MTSVWVCETEWLNEWLRLREWRCYSVSEQVNVWPAEQLIWWSLRDSAAAHWEIEHAWWCGQSDLHTNALRTACIHICIHNWNTAHHLVANKKGLSTNNINSLEQTETLKHQQSTISSTKKSFITTKSQHLYHSLCHCFPGYQHLYHSLCHCFPRSQYLCHSLCHCFPRSQYLCHSLCHCFPRSQHLYHTM